MTFSFPGTFILPDITMAGKQIIELLNRHILPLESSRDLDPLMERIGEARIVMLGEASHGTHEYYTWRSRLSKRLIAEKGFDFIAVEGDWPDCYKINRYIKHYGPQQEHAIDVIKLFDRWPTWMWANWEVVALAEWMKQYNSQRQGHERTGFYGLDVYSLWDSLYEIREYLQKTDPALLPDAERAFRCFEPYHHDEGQSYARATRLVPASCEQEVIKVLHSIQSRMQSYDHDVENAFSTEQNALIAVNAEKYYRSMLEGGAASWNIRDEHMQETLERLLDFHGSTSKAIVWAHNTHIGDASATDMADEGMYNIGELARRHFGRGRVVLVGFGSYTGSVVAGSRWGADMEVMEVPQAMSDSWEEALHETDHVNKMLLMEELRQEPLLTDEVIGHRAIGVVYNPRFEQYGNYVPSRLPLRYDAFIHIDETKALHALDVKADIHKMPETYPFGE
ncbi:MAG: erythromycin esterase family protein [Chitinophagaceae bacterium]